MVILLWVDVITVNICYCETVMHLSSLAPYGKWTQAAAYVKISDLHWGWLGVMYASKIFWAWDSNKHTC